jgi:hypothetical protein
MVAVELFEWGFIQRDECLAHLTADIAFPGSQLDPTSDRNPSLPLHSRFGTPRSRPLDFPGSEQRLVSPGRIPVPRKSSAVRCTTIRETLTYEVFAGDPILTDAIVEPVASRGAVSRGTNWEYFVADTVVAGTVAADCSGCGCSSPQVYRPTDGPSLRRRSSWRWSTRSRTRRPRRPHDRPPGSARAAPASSSGSARRHRRRGLLRRRGEQRPGRTATASPVGPRNGRLWRRLDDERTPSTGCSAAFPVVHAGHRRVPSLIGRALQAWDRAPRGARIGRSFVSLTPEGSEP